uniref:hypothetical protein n=1 Tax=Escherichia coli TaxID=562 RepID=UPI0018E44CF0
KKLIMLPSEIMIWQPEFTDKILSRKPGAVQSYRAEAIAILEKQGARKLGEVTDENLAEVITLAEKALEG